MELIDWDNKNWKEKENGDFIFNLANINVNIFDETAKKWALVIANVDKGVEKNQLRNFYEKVLELEEKALNSTEEEFLKKVLPFVKMLNSKVVYAKNKQSSPVNIAFVEFMSESIGQVRNIETFKNFKFLFEAIIGFYEKEDSRKNIFFIKQNKEKNDNRSNQYNKHSGGKR